MYMPYKKSRNFHSHVFDTFFFSGIHYTEYDFEYIHAPTDII